MKYHKYFLVIAILIFVLTFILALTSFDIFMLKKIFITLTHPNNDHSLYTILFKIRLPRIILAMLVGAGLSVSGASLQCILKNPLAEPFTLGIAGGASLGVAIASLVSTVSMPFGALIGAFSSMFIVYMLASTKELSTIKLLLSGVIVNIITSSCVIFIASLSNKYSFQTAMTWLMGSISYPDYTHLLIIAVIIILCITLLIFMGNFIDILSIGEEKAKYLGLNTKRTTLLIFILSSIITGVCVASAGIIAFIGIITPHFIRQIISAKSSTTMLFSAIIGACFLMIADALARTIFYPVELPVGIITGIIGGILFLIIFTKFTTWRNI